MQPAPTRYGQLSKSEEERSGVPPYNYDMNTDGREGWPPIIYNQPGHCTYKQRPKAPFIITNIHIRRCIADAIIELNNKNKFIAT